MAKKKRYKPYRIIRDSRERKGNGWYFRATAYCDGMDIKKLETGDYSIAGFEDYIMIERKTISDLWQTLTKERDRFIREMERASEIPASYIVVEGSLKDVLRGCRYSKVSPEFIISSLISIEHKYGVRVIFADKNKKHAQRYIRKLLYKLYQYCIDGVITKEDAHGRPQDIE